MKALILAGAALAVAVGLVTSAPPPRTAQPESGPPLAVQPHGVVMHDELRWTEQNSPYVVAKIGAPMTAR